MISRENYEIWFINYLDGQLNPGEMEILGVFLKQNPDLEEELEGVRSCHLLPDEVTFPGKEHLLKDEAAEMGIDRSDYLLVKQLEESLSNLEESELAKLIEADASLENRVAIYAQLKLQPAPVVYPHTRRLLRPKVAAALWLRRFAAAAAILVLLFTGWQWLKNRPDVPVEHLTRLVPRQLPSGAIPVTPVVPLLKGTESVIAGASINPLVPVIFMQEEKKSQFRPELVQPQMSALPSRGLHKNALASAAPNAYELGLNSMMPLLLDLNNQNQMVAQMTTNTKDNIIIRGLQLIDRVTGELIQFNKIYDEEGTYVAYNLQTPVFKIESKLDKPAKD